VSTEPLTTVSDSAYVAKLDSNGNIQWQNSYRGLDVAQAKDIWQTTDGGYVIAGYTAPSQFGTQQVWIAKLDFSGNVQWQKSLSDSNNACYGAYGDSVKGGVKPDHRGGVKVDQRRG
jgi:hypothetical protein